MDEIVILGGENNTTMSEVNRLLAEIPASVRAITGVDLTKVSHTPAPAIPAALQGIGNCLKDSTLIGSFSLPSHRVQGAPYLALFQP